MGREKIVAGKSWSQKDLFQNEKLLQYIWQFQYFNQSSLTTVTGESLQVLSAGTLNKNQGPDFLNARVRIGNMVLAGSVELHCRSSQWNEHGHSSDKNYNNVILHVVYQNDGDKAFHLPVLELESRVPAWLMERYSEFMNGQSFIPCQNSIHHVDEIVLLKWKERVLIERLERKSIPVLSFLEKNKFDWGQVFWMMLARNFGTKVNTDAFEAIARSLPQKLIARHRYQIHHLEALLLGQANLLHKEFTEEYPRMLKREYLFLKKKYGLQPIDLPIHFLRMRPGNFPSLRLAQLAMILHEKDGILKQVLDADDLKLLFELFSATPNDYWLYHYLPDEPSEYKKKPLGKVFISNIIANTVVSFLYTYGGYHKNESFQSRAIKFLHELEAEENSITNAFKLLGAENKSAADSQSLLELKVQYCEQQRCLECAIGFNLLRKNRAT